jgi:hypothetical protein
MCDSGGKLQKVVDGYQNYEQMTGALDSDFQTQKGGGTGYILDLEQPRVGGQPQVTGYVSQPEYLNGSLVQQRTDDGRLMGDADLCGGGKKKKLNNNKKGNSNNNVAMMMNQNNNVRVNNVRVNNAKVNNNGTNKVAVNNVAAKVNKPKRSKKSKKNKKRRFSMKKRRYHTKKRKGMRHRVKKGKGMKKGKGKRSRHGSKYRRKKRSKNRKRHGKKMKGGDGCSYEVQGDGQASVFTDDMSQRSFDCNQPNWDAKCT